MKTFVSNHFVLNSDKVKVRTEVLNGINYLVGPTSLMTEGVHVGSLGPLYYSKSELRKWTAAWNHRPILIEHPVKGRSTKEVVENQKIGFILDPVYKDKQKAEFWIDQNRCESLDPALAARVMNGEAIEGSTGMELDIVDSKGVWNGESYTGLAVNHRPDHYAILPNGKGACSVSDGGGFCVNSSHPVNNDRMMLHLKNVLGFHASKVEVSFDEITEQIYDLLRSRFGKRGVGWYGCICAVYPDRVIFDNDESPYQMLMLGYTVSTDGVVSLSSGDPIQVERVVTYQSANGGYDVANSTGEFSFHPKNGESMTPERKKEILDVLVGEGKLFPETDRKTVENMSEVSLEQAFKVVTTKPEPPKVENGDNVKLAKTVEELGKFADPKVWNAVQEIILDHDEQRAERIKVVVENTGLSEAEANELSNAALKKMASKFAKAKNDASVGEFRRRGPYALNGSPDVAVKNADGSTYTPRKLDAPVPETTPAKA